MQVTFNELPSMISMLYERVLIIEKLLRDNKAKVAEVPQVLYTIQQASNFVSLSVPTMYRLVSSREVPFMKKGKRLYFCQHELTEWIKAGRKRTLGEIESQSEGLSSSKPKNR